MASYHRLDLSPDFTYNMDSDKLFCKLHMFQKLLCNCLLVFVFMDPDHLAQI